MKSIKKFDIGSRIFFENYFNDYKIKDIDEIHIMDSWYPKDTNVLNLKKDSNDIFFFKNMTKEEFIKDALSCDVSLRVGKFLVPEFCNYINFTIDDLKTFKNMFDELDDKHKYEKIIYNSYIENNGFFLTDEQRKTAYKEYSKFR